MLGVQTAIDVEAILQIYNPFWLGSLQELLFGIVVLQPGCRSARLLVQHKELLLHGLQLLEVATQRHAVIRY